MLFNPLASVCMRTCTCMCIQPYVRAAVSGPCPCLHCV